MERDVLSLIKRLQALTDQYRVDDFLDLFNEDAQFQIVGHSILSGKGKIREVFEYDAGASTELRFINFVPHYNALTCQLFARNDRLKAMGIDNVFYTSCILSLKEGRIQQFVAIIEEETSRRIRQRLQAFVAWLARAHPAEFSRLCSPDGNLIYSAENGRESVLFIKEWWDGVLKG